MKYLVGKRILILSPQEWGHVHVSKHHYAEELARAGNRVVFLDPPAAGAQGVTLREVSSNLSVASWALSTPKLLRFHAMALYRRLVRRDVRRIERAVGPVDVVWAFDFNTFPDLDAFTAEALVFQPVDPIAPGAQVDCGLKADLVVSISSEILATFDEARFAGRKLLVDHGLSDEFAAEAGRPPVPPTPGAPVRAGFFGNLDRPVVNRAVFAELAAAHSDVEFHFWGPAAPDGPFRLTLGGMANVHWHGPVDKACLVEAVRPMDVLLLVYGTDYTYDRSNAHKILEYLATGKVIVSSRIARYSGRPDLLRVPDDGDDAKIPALFAETIEALGLHNSPNAMAARKKYAARYSYRGIIAEIDARLAEALAALRGIARVS